MDKTLRIALIRQRYTPFGGAERFVENALNALQKRSNIELTLITRKWDGADSHNIRKIICNPFYIGRLWRDWSFARCACKIVNNDKFDLVQSHERVPCGDIYRAGDGVHREWLNQRKKITSSWKQWFDWLSPYHRYLLHQEQRVFEGSDRKAIIAISSMVKSDILRHYNPTTDIHTIINSVDLDRFHPKHREEFRPKLLAALGLTEDNRIILFVGSGFHRKGLLTLLNALSLIPEHIHLVVVGKDKRIGSYQKFTQQKGINKRVHFIGPTDNPVPYYASADLFTFPTFYEPFSNAVLEAMASGIPAIISNTCGAKDLIEQDVNGKVLAPDNPVDWSTTISKYLHDNNIEKMRKSARKTAEQQETERLASKLIATYRTVLDIT